MGVKIELTLQEIGTIQSGLNSLIREAEKEHTNKKYSSKDKRSLTKYKTRAEKLSKFLLNEFGRNW